MTTQTQRGMVASNGQQIYYEVHGDGEPFVKHDALDRVGSINAPTMVITGEQDRLTPPWIGRELATAIPHAKFHLVEGSGSSHVLPLERPDDFNRIVISFLGAKKKGHN
jgi:3-oxoadipate enol-lactonase